MLKHAPSEQPGKATLCGLFEGYATIAFLAVDCKACTKIMAAPAVSDKVAADIPFGLEHPDFEVVWIRIPFDRHGNRLLSWYRVEVYHNLAFGPDVAGGEWEYHRGAIYDVFEGSDLRWLAKKAIRQYPNAKYALKVIPKEGF